MRDWYNLTQELNFKSIYFTIIYKVYTKYTFKLHVTDFKLKI